MTQPITTQHSAFWTVRKRIAWSYSTVVLITIALGLYAFERLYAIRHDSARLSLDSLPALTLINQVDSLSGQIYALTLKHTVSTDAEAERAMSQIRANLERMKTIRCLWGMGISRSMSGRRPTVTLFCSQPNRMRGVKTESC